MPDQLLLGQGLTKLACLGSAESGNADALCRTVACLLLCIAGSYIAAWAGLEPVPITQCHSKYLHHSVQLSDTRHVGLKQDSMLKIPVASRYGSHLQQLPCYRKFASLSPVQASIEPHPEVQGVYTLTLNRPEAKNSLGHQLIKQLRNSLQAFKHQQARCLLINSAVKGTFCAGADLKVYLLRTTLLLLPYPSKRVHQRKVISADHPCLVFYRNEQQCLQRKVESLSKACAPRSARLRYIPDWCTLLPCRAAQHQS